MLSASIESSTSSSNAMPLLYSSVPSAASPSISTSSSRRAFSLLTTSRTRASRCWPLSNCAILFSTDAVHLTSSRSVHVACHFDDTHSGLIAIRIQFAKVNGCLPSAWNIRPRVRTCAMLSGRGLTPRSDKETPPVPSLSLYTLTFAYPRSALCRLLFAWVIVDSTSLPRLRPRRSSMAFLVTSVSVRCSPGGQ